MAKEVGTASEMAATDPSPVWIIIFAIFDRNLADVVRSPLPSQYKFPACTTYSPAKHKYRTIFYSSSYYQESILMFL